jgi:acetoacetyl-CoA synthetase
MADPPVLWSPPPDVRSTSRVGHYLDWLERERGLRLGSYDELWRWSTDDLGAFWQSVWDHLDVRSATAVDTPLADPSMPGARWFPGAKLNWAEHALRLRQWWSSLARRPASA